MNPVEHCPHCHAEVNWTDDRCLVCNKDLGVPNQRLANRENELKALNKRYITAVKIAEKRGVSLELLDFEQNIANNSGALINCTVKFLSGFMIDKNQLYANYRQQTDAATRKVAEFTNDRERCGTEGTLYGSLAAHISYAALSLNVQGLISYGNCAMVLKEITLNSKATVLEENSYDFVRRHKILPGNTLPEGYWANWQNRQLLAVAKLGDKVNSGVNDFAAILLTSNGNRNEDQFIEVHIYGSFDKQAIASLALPKKNMGKEDKVLLNGIRNYADHHKMPCTDYD